MKKTWIIRALLLIAYCIPFAFLSVNGDATSGTMCGNIGCCTYRAYDYCADLQSEEKGK